MTYGLIFTKLLILWLIWYCVGTWIKREVWINQLGKTTPFFNIIISHWECILSVRLQNNFRNKWNNANGIHIFLLEKTLVCNITKKFISWDWKWGMLFPWWWQWVPSHLSNHIGGDSTPVSWGYWQQRSDTTQPAGTVTRQACWQIWPAARPSPLLWLNFGFFSRFERHFSCSAPNKQICL